MRSQPSIAAGLPDDFDVYLVRDDFGQRGRAWRELDEEQTDRETIITDMMRGEFNSPVRVIAFNTAEGWSRDVSKEIADELRRRINSAYVDVPASLEDFVDRYAGGRPVQLPLPLKGAA
jgi:hypothetical protein